MMTGNMLKEFIKLYNDDLNNYGKYIKYEKDYFIKQPEIQELLYEIKDYDYYVIDWGLNMTTKGIMKKYKKDYDLIIRLYTMNKLYLRPKQIDDFLEKRGEKKYPHYELIGKRRCLKWN